MATWQGVNKRDKGNTNLIPIIIINYSFKIENI